MARQDRREMDPEEYDKPLPKPKPLPFLPEREWLKGRINKADYGYVYFKGQIQYLTDQNKEPVLDADGQMIERRQFEIEIYLNDYNLPNGEPRRVWLKLGASLGPKAHLPQFLRNMGLEVEGNPTPQEIVDYLKDLDVKFQLATKHSDSSGNDYQQVIWDSVKPA